MATLYRLEEWQGGSGNWYCEHTSSFPEGVQKWVCPARILDMTVDEFIKWVVDIYKPDRFFYSEDYSFIGFSWKSQEQMRKYKNYINRKAREKNFMI